MNFVKSLLLIWKCKKDSLYYHVGTLSYDGNLYKFEYTHASQSTRDVKSAMKQGYSLLPAFPLLKVKYEAAHLFEAFNRRIPDRSRVGYGDFIKDYGLTERADRMDILQATRGALANDPYTFEQPLRLNGDKLSASFFINGMRHRDELKNSWMHEVTAGDLLLLQLEPENEIDPHAIRVLTKQGLHLGYIPGVYNQALHALLTRGVPLTLRVKKIRPSFAPQWWVEVSFEARVDLQDAESLEKSTLIHVLQRAIA
ncbi:HIRAN domain-containing protein [Planococcus lenghuensis]|uniref:HIRAN domain-containing protein n=1 Tax=Planococcus lenghuensis TaxID=2213202 RepID=A0A1Q2L0X4_9BACL|nr:HIRAN domain-containing protein [Planococcus lenghuensis]AQQ54110.1 hypothetical protein B0X71_14020 [Planococcus lenghuensis]